MAVSNIAPGVAPLTATTAATTTFEAGRRYTIEDLRATVDRESMISNIRRDIAATVPRIQALSERLTALIPRQGDPAVDQEQLRSEIKAVSSEVERLGWGVQVAQAQMIALTTGEEAALQQAAILMLQNDARRG